MNNRRRDRCIETAGEALVPGILNLLGMAADRGHQAVQPSGEDDRDLLSDAPIGDRS